MNVPIGTTVKWTNQDGVPHTTTSGEPNSPSGMWDSDRLSRGDSFTFTFTEAGPNPYFCQFHGAAMVGSVAVGGPPAGPPGVPAAAPGIPMTVDKPVPDGTTLSIAWDTATCAPANSNHQIVIGRDIDLPTALGNRYGLIFGLCGIGNNSPFIWNPSPTPASGSFIWWLVLATDNVTTEGSWGKHSGPGERDGFAAGGHSAQCDVMAKDLTNPCGQ